MSSQDSIWIDYKEYEHLCEKQGKLSPYFILTYAQEDEFRFILYVANNLYMGVKMIFPNEYPFKPPTVSILDGRESEITTYLAFCRDISRDQFLNIRDCLCCGSLMCGDNWSVNKDAIAILKEVYEMYMYRRRHVEKICCNSMIRQRFGNPAEDLIKFGKITRYL